MIPVATNSAALSYVTYLKDYVRSSKGKENILTCSLHMAVFSK